MLETSILFIFILVFEIPIKIDYGFYIYCGNMVVDYII